MESEFVDGVMIIYATIELPGNNTLINHVWQQSSLFLNGFPNGHRTSGQNVLSKGVLDLLSGQFTASRGSRVHLKNVSCGLFMNLRFIFFAW